MCAEVRTEVVPNLNNREHSSAGSEHLPYKQRVRGSNPFAPTKKQKDDLGRLFCFYAYASEQAPVIGTKHIAFGFILFHQARHYSHNIGVEPI